MEPEDMRGGGFPATRHSAIERIRDGNPEARREAFGDLVEGYWKPVYKHLRLAWRLDVEDARDLTQGFFADAFQKSWLERYEPGKAKFRTFVQPGEVLSITAALEHEGSGYTITKAFIEVNGKRVCDATLTFRVVDFPNPDMTGYIRETATRIGLLKLETAGG